MITAPAASPREAQMLCWLASGEHEHEALERDMKRVRILIPAREYRHLQLKFTPRSAVITAPAAPPREAQMLCWLASGEHEALQRDMKRVRMLITAEGRTTSTARDYPTEPRDNGPRRPS